MNSYFEKVELSYSSLFGIFFLLSIFTVSYYYFNYVNINIDFIIKFFFIIFFSSCLYSIYNYQPDVPFFCGGVSSFIKSDILINQSGADIKQVRLSFKELIYSENSHLGMIAPSIFVYSIYKINNKKLSIFEIFFIFLFIFICLIKSSTTLLIGTIISLLAIIFFNFKELNRITLLSFFAMIVFFITTILLNDECRARFVPIYGWNDNNDIRKLAPNIVGSHEDAIVEGFNKDLAFKIRDVMNIDGNLSSGIYFHSLLVAKKSIIEKPFGWGLNRYQYAFNHYNKKTPPRINALKDSNNKDGTNNLVKILVEFGVFGILFYFFIFIFLINKRIPIELKLFYLPFIITQSLRGAGYFNSGFLLIAFMMLFTYISIYKKK